MSSYQPLFCRIVRLRIGKANPKALVLLYHSTIDEFSSKGGIS